MRVLRESLGLSQLGQTVQSSRLPWYASLFLDPSQGKPHPGLAYFSYWLPWPMSRAPNGSGTVNLLTAVPSLGHLWGSLSLSSPLGSLGKDGLKHVIKSCPMFSLLMIQWQPPSPSATLFYSTLSYFPFYILRSQGSRKSIQEENSCLLITTCPDIVLRISHVTHLIFRWTLWGRYNYPYFTDEEKMKNIKVTLCQRS